MEAEKLPTGSPIDNLLGGGFEKDIVTTLFGPGGSGKTNICLHTLIRLTGTGKKVIYIDTEQSFSVERLRQLTRHAEKVLSHLVFFHPKTFSEQDTSIKQLPQLLTAHTGLIIVDTVSMLYRLALSQSNNVPQTNSQFAKQIATLIRCARDKHVPVLLTTQVYTDPETDKVKMIGGDMLKNGSRCLIELRRVNQAQRQAILRKHRSLPERHVNFAIRKEGLVYLPVKSSAPTSNS